MHQPIRLLGALALTLALAACGGGDSDNTLQTGVGGTGNVGAPSTPPGPVPTPTVARQDGTGTGMTDRELAFASEVFELVNAYRQANGRSALQWDAPTAGVSQTHTVENMQRPGVLTHAGPPPCTIPDVCLAQRLTNGGVTFLGAGDNVAHVYLTSQQVMDAWIASPTHIANLLDSTWTHMGVGFREGASPSNAAMTGPWWTQVFVQK